MRGRVYASFAPNQSIMVQFSTEVTVSGLVVWSEDGHIGIEFANPIDVASVLSNVHKSLRKRKIARAPRLKIECGGTIKIGDRNLSIRLQDISQRGAKVLSSFIRPGDEVEVDLGGIERRATVCWTRGEYAGLNFVRSLSYEELAQWVIDQKLGCHNLGANPTTASTKHHEALLEN